MPGFPLSLLLLPRMEYSFLISSHHDVVIRGSGMSCCGTALMSGTGTVFLPYLPRAPDIRKIARSPLLLLGIVVVITSSGCDLYSPSLASLKHTTCMACILRLSGSWAWLESHTHARTHTLRLCRWCRQPTKPAQCGGTGCRNNAAVHTVWMLGPRQLTLRKLGHRYRPM